MKNPFRRIFRRSREKPDEEGIKSDTLTPDGLRVTEFPRTVVQMLKLYGFGASYSQMYARQPNVRAVVDTIASHAASLGAPKHFEKVPRSPLLPSERLELSSSDMSLLLQEPSPNRSSYRFWYDTVADLCVYETALWLKIRSNGAEAPPTGLLRVPPQNLMPQRDPLTGAILYWTDAQGKQYFARDLVVFPGYDPESDSGAISPMETLRRILAEEFAADADREGRWKNALRKEFVIEQDSAARPMTDEALESFMIDLEDALQGADNSGRPAVLQPGMKAVDMTWNPKDMEYLEGRKLRRVEVCAQFHMPPKMVAASGDPDEQTLKFFYKATLPPYLTRIESEIKAQLLPDFVLVRDLRRRQYVEFNLDTQLRGSPEEQMAIMATAAGGPVVTVNEARARLNLPPIEGGDLIFVPLNSVRAGGPQGSPQSPIDTPAAGVQPVGTTPGGGTQPSASAADSQVVIMGTQKALPPLPPPPDDGQGAKAAQESFLRETRARYEERHAAQMSKFFSRQRAATAAGKDMNRKRWDKELADDLFGIAYQVVEIVGEDTAQRIGGTWDQSRTANYLRKNVEFVASAVNDETEAQLAGESDLDAVFGEGRASQIAKTRTTFAVNWAIMEAAHQNGK